MYGLMLAAMMTTGTATPDWGCHHASCYGCSCYGGGNAFSYVGCGGCSGVAGCWASYGCSCYGGCYGGSCYGGCYGCSCYGGAYGVRVSGWGCHGCSCYGGCYGCAGYAIVAPAYAVPAMSPGGGTAPKMEMLPKGPKEDPKKGAMGAPANEATGHVTVRLPADARLYVDDVACPLTSATRSFNTPALEPGRQYYYTLKAEVTRDGRVASESKRVIVQAGQEASVDFGDLRTVRAASR